MCQLGWARLFSVKEITQNFSDLSKGELLIHAPFPYGGSMSCPHREWLPDKLLLEALPGKQKEKGGDSVVTLKASCQSNISYTHSVREPKKVTWPHPTSRGPRGRVGNWDGWRRRIATFPGLLSLPKETHCQLYMDP